MLASAIIVFREMIEAGLIVGIVLAVTANIPDRGRWVWGGLLGGLAGAGVVALFADALSSAFAGAGQELFNAGILITAVVMLAWHNIWMAQHGREMAADLRAVGQAVAAGKRSLSALALVVGIAVLREGSEVVLFLYGVLVANGGSNVELFAGGMLGLVLGGALSALTYLGLVKIPSKHLFLVTGWLITLLAAGMAGQAVVFLEQAGYVTLLPQTVWDTSALLPDSSLFGKVLHTLFGYSDRPSAMQLLVYVLTLAAITLLTKLFSPSASPAPSTKMVSAI
ncbi:MAG: FTR1 family protein [Beijerinckiaceae bacterium]|nr:FTR1 family protein [Beijerinckiaceae bacterium]